MKHVPSFAEIDGLCNQFNAKRIAVENFLMSLDLTMPPQFHMQNLVSDARLYQWPQTTVDAIQAGIKLAYGGQI